MNINASQFSRLAADTVLLADGDGHRYVLRRVPDGCLPVAADEDLKRLRNLSCSNDGADTFDAAAEGRRMAAMV